MSDDPSVPMNSIPKKAEPMKVAPMEGRDKRGRWIKGHCPNPKGRPKKMRFKDYNPSDPKHFFSTQIEVKTADGTQAMDRKAALLHKMFETAMRGGVMAQRMAWEMIKETEQQIADLRVHFDRRLTELVLDNPDFKDMDESLSREEKIELFGMAKTLNHYFPGQYDAILGGGKPEIPVEWVERLKRHKSEEEEG